MEELNPPNNLRIFTFILIVLPFLIWSIYKYLDNGSVQLLIISIFVVTLIVTGILFAEIIHKPRKIEIHDSGVRLYFRIRNTYFATWQDISFLDLDKGDSNLFGKYKRGGQIGLKKLSDGRIPFLIPVFQLTYEVAELIKEAYKDKIGSYPATR